ncbi:MAG: hypothetical protein H7Y39_02260 [Nitrospiraceae bacterium]|nr:hypothetical protein [Nitrospiraceae bacterium]
MVTTMTLKEYLAEQAGRGVPAHDRLKRLTGDSERLNAHVWTDEQLEAIPEELIHFAFEHSGALQREFGDITTFMAYRRAHGAGRARIAGVRR